MKYAIMSLLVLIIILPVHAWTKSRDFEGTVGEKAQGPSGFDNAGTATIYSSEAANSGTGSAKMSWTAGINGFGVCTGEHYYATNLREGDELWVRGYYYFKAPWDWTTPTYIKIMRIHVATSSGSNIGYQSLLSDGGGQIVGNTEVADRNYYTNHGYDLDRWQSLEMYVMFSSSAGIFRAWKDGILILEDKSSKTLSSSSDYADFSYFMSYWNGGCPQNQVMYMDDVVMTTDTPSARDAAGNPMIGPSGSGGTGPVCGSNGCEPGETCSSCQADCGTCPCAPNWICASWSSCIDSQQTRTCSDSNSCGTTAGKPATTQSCSSCTPSAEICGNSVDEDCDGSDMQCVGTQITVDSTYEGYGIGVIDDNNTDPFSGTSTTWASGETTGAHWILFTFPTEQDISRIDVYWAYNPVRQQYMSSQELQVQYWDGSKYVTVSTITNSGSMAESTASFQKVSTTRLRLYQPASKGSAVYPAVLWLTEVDYGNGVHEADTDCSGCIEQDELLAYITDWKTGKAILAILMEAIRLWKGGC
jgi:hypothetical protein